jgi:acyl dehydratase
MPTEPRVGDAIPELTFPVEVGPMKVFSVLMGDPNPIHFDPDFVRSLGLGDRPVNQGTITMGYAVSAVLAWAGGVERLLRFQCRFLANVVAGDLVTAGGTVTAVESTPSGGTASLDIWLERAGERVLTGSATVALA